MIITFPTRANAGLMIPLPAVVAALTMEQHGHTLGGFPPFTCAPAKSDLIFYPLVFLTNVFIVTGIPMLIIVVWSLHKVWFIR